MGPFKYLIIGGGIAGTTAAETIRQNDADGTIVIVSDEPYRLYSRIILSKPNFFLEKMPFDQIWLKPESWYAENKIELMYGRKATRLDAARKEIALDDGRQLSYQKLLISIGGCVRRLNIQPETFSRALKKLEKYGVMPNGHKIIIQDINKLANFCEVDDRAALC